MTFPATEQTRKVTVGIPTRNRSGYVVRAVHSVLAQTYRDIEVVISDNASTDDTVRAIEGIRDPRIVLIKHATNIGMLGNFNVCLNNANGRFFLMLSDDDILEPTAIEELSLPFFNPPTGITTEAIGMAWCPCIVVNAAGETLYTTTGGPPRETVAQLLSELFNGNRGMRFCSVLVRTGDARKVGGYRDRYGAVSDISNWGQAALHHEYAVCVNRALARYTIHASSETSKSACRDWQNWSENLHSDLLAIVRERGDRAGEKRLQAAHRNAIAGLTVAILMQAVGRPGWIRRCFAEVYHARRYLLTPYTIRRLILDGWKIIRLLRR